MSKATTISYQDLKAVDLFSWFFQGPDLATEDEYWDLWEAVKVDDIELVSNSLISNRTKGQTHNDSLRTNFILWNTKRTNSR